MNTRQRFLETLRYGRPDRFPYLDYTIRDDVLATWGRDGLHSHRDVARRFELERLERVGPHCDVELDLRARPEYEGRLRGRADWERLCKCFDPGTPARYPLDWVDRVQGWRERTHPLGLVVWRGLFLPLQVGDWATLTDLLYLLHDDPLLVEEMLASIAEFNLSVLERALREVDWDFALFEEPIAGNYGPVVSPAHYRRFCLPHMKRIADRVRAAGIDLLVADSQGAVGTLVPLWLEAGLNALWLGDVAASGLDYLELRRRYGRDLRLVGGIDIRVLSRDRSTVEHEVMRLVPPLLEQGGYIPLLDGRVRRAASFENYVRYRELLCELAGNFGQGRV
jgi:hypothetical protein